MIMPAWRSTLSATVLALAASGHAMAHAVIKQSVPAQGAVLASSPKKVTIAFNEKVEPMFTSASVSTAAGVKVSQEKASIDPADPTVLQLPLPTLARGQYLVKWHAVGGDGHRRHGEIRFSVQ